LASQKDTKHYCKAIIILRGTKWGILALCYVGNWSVARGVTIELHKLWFCHDDQSCCVGSGLLLFEKPKFHPKNFFNDDANLLVNKPTDANN
jgi:hypothetical protein